MLLRAASRALPPVTRSNVRHLIPSLTTPQSCQPCKQLSHLHPIQRSYVFSLTLHTLVQQKLQGAQVAQAVAPSLTLSHPHHVTTSRPSGCLLNSTRVLQAIRRQSFRFNLRSFKHLRTRTLRAEVAKDSRSGTASPNVPPAARHCSLSCTRLALRPIRQRSSLCKLWSFQKPQRLLLCPTALKQTR